MIIFDSIEISNFRNIQHSNLKGLKDINIFIGPNNCGKSNFLEAIKRFDNIESSKGGRCTCKPCQIVMNNNFINEFLAALNINDVYEKITYKGKEFWFSCNKTPWFGVNGNIMGVMCISRDVIERKKMADDALSIKKIFFNALMDNIPDSIYFKDTKSRFVLINKALSEKVWIRKARRCYWFVRF